MDEFLNQSISENQSFSQEDNYLNESGTEPVNLLEDREEKLILPPVGKEKGKGLRAYQKAYPIAFDMARFELRDNRTIEQIMAARRKAEYELKKGHALMGGEAQKEASNQNSLALMSKSLSFKERVQREAVVFDAEAAILYKNKRFMKHDREEMRHVKRCMAALRNFLQEDDMKDLRRPNNTLDPNAFWQKVNLAYQTTIEACDDYLDNKHPSRWFGKGMKRYQMVYQLKKRCERELLGYKNAKDQLVQHAIIGVSGDLKSPREVLENIKVSEVVGDPVWMNHGNSTDVYRVKIRMGDSGELRTFYMKENLQLLSVDLPAFVNRRLNQLTLSKEHMGDENLEESRMKENHADLQDYSNGIALFKAMKEALDKAKGPDRLEMEKRYVDFFGQDFDGMFKALNDYNGALTGKVSVNDLLKRWKAKLKEDENNELAKEVVKNLKLVKGEKSLKPMTAADWIKVRVRSGKMGLDEKKDAHVLSVLYKMQEKGASLKESGIGRIETFLRITCGKEVELYGQMRARGGSTDDDIAATNNTATAMLAKETGFKDIICSSFSSMVDIKRRDGTKGPGFFTIIEAAEGDELVELQHRAIEENKKLVLSSKAVMQLQELYSFDLTCLQVDRHGRNFRCQYEEQGNEIIIKTVKAYDNDMSFTEETLETAFLAEDKKGTKKAGFLPPLFKTVKKNSLEYAHIAKNYFDREITRELTIQEKTVMHASKEGKEDLELNDKENDRFLSIGLTFFVNLDAPGEVYERGETESLDGRVAHEVQGQLYRLTKYQLKNIILKEDADAIVDEYLDSNSFITNKILKQPEDLTKEEKKKLGAILYELQQLHEKYDFSHISLTGLFEAEFRRDQFTRIREILDADTFDGAVQAWFDSILYCVSNLYGKDQDVLEGYESKRNQSLGEMSHLVVKEGEDKPAEEGDLYVPTLLHFSNKAYQNLLSMQQKLNAEDGDEILLQDLENLNINDKKSGKQKRSKLAALRMRVNQQIKQLQQAEQAAKYFYRAKGYQGVHAKFFLTDEEAEQITDLGEFTWNAGETYLAIDNDEYLAGQDEFFKLMKEDEKTQWLKSTNDRYTDQKRHKFHKVNNLRNPLSNKIYKG